MRSSYERGFSLIEVLVVTVLGTLLAVGTFKIVNLTQRINTAQAAQVRGQQSLRAGLGILYAELRELSPSDGDLLTMATDSISFRAMRQVGYVCVTNYSTNPPRFTLRRTGRWLGVGDSIVALADNDPTKAVDDRWITGKVTSADTTSTCSGLDKAQDVYVEGLSPSDTIRIGAMVRSYAPFTYGLFEFDGQPFLGRRSAGASPQPLVGPLRGKSEGGLAFTYLDANNAVTLVGSDVAQIQVELRTASRILGTDGRPVSDSIVTRIYPRN
jgi:prepilin-type N-terminal cleavage/methylation domain-containing protein